MLKNYLKIALRSFTKHRIYSLINILGLSIGLTVVLLIALTIKYEHSSNSFNKNENRIYRVGLTLKIHGKVMQKSPDFVAALGPAMLKDMPEVENYVRISTPRTMYFIYGGHSFKTEDVAYADSSVFNIFSFNLVSGNRNKCLTGPYSVVLTQTTALRIFGSNDPVGEIVTIGNSPYKVTGVAEDPPSNSDVRFDAVISFSTLYNKPGVFLGWNGGNQYITYVLLRKNASMETVNRRFPSFLWPYINKLYSTGGWKEEAHLEPLEDIHLYYNADSAAIRENLNVYLAIAIFILLIACANFVNLSTARAAGRMQEVGMRKVLGAERRSLVLQFLAESVLISFFALLLAVMLVEVLTPWYNGLIGKHIVLSQLFDGQFISILIAVLAITGLVAGFYPALFLSSFRPADTLKGGSRRTRQRHFLRESLVILQFAISVVLIVSTFVISEQLGFMRSKYLGFDRENMLVMPLVNGNLRTEYRTFKTEVREIPGVLSAAASSDVPLNGFTGNGYLPEGYTSPIMFNVVDVDDDFMSTYGLTLLKGKSFSAQIASDKNTYMINEALAKRLGWSNPIGREIDRNGKHTVIGEVKDFNYASLYYPVAPLIITNNPGGGGFGYVSIRLGQGNLPKTMAAIRRVWRKFAPAAPFEYFFLDRQFDKVYKSDIAFHESFVVFSSLAIFVALLGLLGLVSYSVELKRREIGIRKVLGSSVPGILSLLSKEYLKWVVIANVIGWPVAYFVMQKWLANFAYRTGMDVWVFVVSAILVLVVAFITIGLQALRAATTNPIQSLRYE